MRAKHALTAAAALAIAAAAVAQEKPESLLPPGFGQSPAPAPTPSATAMSPLAPAASAAPGELPPLPPLVLPSPTPSASPTVDAAQLALAEMPAFARRSLAHVGPVGAGEGGLPADAFGRADGRYLEVLMRRLSAPLPSRFLSIALRRALVSRVDTPAHVSGADFAAERAWLLLRMGEAVAARAVVQSVDAGNVSPKLAQVWMQAALATADPAALCTLAQAPRVRASERAWAMAQAICTGLTGGNSRAAIADLRRRRVAGGVDLQLAQKVIGAGANSRQAITIEWTPVTELTAWRFGLATATGVAVPDALYATVGPQVTGWRALAPAIPIADRVAPAEPAAAMGVLSSAALVDLYSAVAEADDAPAALRTTANDLRDAYVGQDRATRLNALATLWTAGSAQTRYARLILTARAAGRLTVFDGVKDPDRLIAAMLSAGLDRTALRWRGHVPAGGDAWAMLTLADPDAVGALSWSDVDDYTPGGARAERKRQLFFAAMAGLGRMAPDQVERGAAATDVRIGAESPWTRALGRAAAEGQPATVLLLAAIGMQTSDWSGVPPAALYRIVGALRAVGLTAEARLIAVEALTRV